MKMTRTRATVFIGSVAAIYAVLSLMPGLSVLSFGPIQFRIAEAMCILAILTPYSIPALTLGCFLTNLASPMMAVDLPFGTLATLIAATGTYFLRKKPALAMLMPVISNGIIVGSIISFYTDSQFGLFVNIALVSIGEAGVCYLIGLPLLKAIRRFFAEN